MNTLTIFKRLESLPLGKKLFALLVCRRLPYFKSIRPRIIELEIGRSVVEMSDRRSVRNHLGTVHAIAQCNLCELSMAMTTEATIPPGLRYIPVGMTVEYKKKARGNLRAISRMKPENYLPGTVSVHIDVYDSADIIVMSADIRLDVKPKTYS